MEHEQAIELGRQKVVLQSFGMSSFAFAGRGYHALSLPCINEVRRVKTGEYDSSENDSRRLGDWQVRGCKDGRGSKTCRMGLF